MEDRMLRSLDRLFPSKLAGVLICIASCSVAQAQSGAPTGRGVYLGVFGGGGSSQISGVTQMGTVFFTEVEGGPLNVDAAGGSSTDGVGLFGMQIGHEWASGAPEGGWGLMPAVEVEGMYLAGTQSARLNNPTFRTPEHLFDDSLPMDNFAVLANGVLSFQTPLPNFHPYIGFGLGATNVKVNGASSLQLQPAEAGINHFNSNPNSSDLGISAQAKAGFRIQLTDHLFLFTEYRYLYVASTTQTFGSTQAPTHAVTSPWTVQLDDMNYHLGVGGIGFNF
jgi:opacity protein-like surface antigen